MKGHEQREGKKQRSRLGGKAAALRRSRGQEAESIPLKKAQNPNKKE